MIELNELIERWSNTERVLIAMPEHERQKHWSMGTWGEINDCGTIACAAGHCGLDPWFRERGFKLNFKGGQSQITPVQTFFGIEGSSRIFLNATERPVETVTQEVHDYIAELRRLQTLSTAAGLPKVGEEWPEQGGIFAGARFGLNGQPNYFLVVGSEYEGHCDWDSAMAWAKGLAVGEHRDFRLPGRTEQWTLFDRVKTLFQLAAYWSCEQHASGSVYAWTQDFSSGYQDYWGKNLKLRARAVRSVLIQ